MEIKCLYVVDIRFKKKSNFTLLKYDIKESDIILSLSPYSTFLLDLDNLKHKTYHDIISITDFKKNVFNAYQKVENLLTSYKEYSFILRHLAFIQTYEVFTKYLIDYLEYYKMNNYKIIYVTDSVEIEDRPIDFLQNNYFFPNIKIKKIFISDLDNIFYYKNKLLLKISLLYNKNTLKKIYIRYKNTKKLEFNYDNEHFYNIYNSLNKISITEIDNKIDKFRSTLVKNNYNHIIDEKLNFLLNDINSFIKEFKIGKDTNIHPFTFLSKNKNYAETLYYTLNKIPKIFTQHGSYFHENIFLKYNEIYPADINFVFNDYTKKLFEKRGSKKVYTIGSINFNYPIVEKDKKYDFVYITYCTSYSYAGIYIGDKNTLLSIDANNIYQRHKSIIELFGTKFKDKTICIKIQSGIFTGDMLYIPFLELSKKYKNIKIEFNTSLSYLFEQSKYIISDYFSSEFINREIHYKKDIILFQGEPILLPEDTLEDMNKMFILVDTVDDLETKVQNIEKITKNRKRYDDIIEYYSSKKCDTKKIVTEILEKELDGR